MPPRITEHCMFDALKIGYLDTLNSIKRMKDNLNRLR